MQGLILLKISLPWLMCRVDLFEEKRNILNLGVTFISRFNSHFIP